MNSKYDKHMTAHMTACTPAIKKLYVCENCDNYAYIKCDDDTCDTYWCCSECVDENASDHAKVCDRLCKTFTGDQRYLGISRKLYRIINHIPKLFINKSVFASVVRDYFMKYVVTNFDYSTVFVIKTNIRLFSLYYQVLALTCEFKESSSSVIDTMIKQNKPIMPFANEHLLVVQGLIEGRTSLEHISETFPDISRISIANHIASLKTRATKILIIVFEIAEKNIAIPDDKEETQCVLVSYHEAKTPSDICAEMLMR